MCGIFFFMQVWEGKKQALAVAYKAELEKYNEYMAKHHVSFLAIIVSLVFIFFATFVFSTAIFDLSLAVDRYWYGYNIT